VFYIICYQQHFLSDSVSVEGGVKTASAQLLVISLASVAAELA